MTVWPLLSLVACAPQVASPEPSGDLWVVADTGNGRVLFVDQGSSETVGSLCMADLLPLECTERRCIVFGTTVRHPDPSTGAGDSIDVVYGQLLDPKLGIPGGVASWSWHDGALELDWHVRDLRFPKDPVLDARCANAAGDEPLCGLNMPHVAVRTDDTESLLIADTLNDRILWVEPQGDAPALVTRVLDTGFPGIEEHRWPNNVEQFSRDGRLYILATYKGSWVDPATGDGENLGRIILLDVTDVSRPEVVWRYPAEGALAAVHHGTLQASFAGDLLLYAHSYGSSDTAVGGTTGAIGMARMRFDAPPDYLGDALLDGDELGFVREAEVVDGGSELLVTDSGCENARAACSRPARVLRVGLQLPPEAGLGGGWDPTHGDQVFRSLVPIGEAAHGQLQFPFEADAFAKDDIGEEWANLPSSCGG